MFVAAKLYDRFGASVVVGELTKETLTRAKELIGSDDDESVDDFLEHSAGAKWWLNEFVSAIVSGYAVSNDNGTIDYFGEEVIAFAADTEQAAKAGLLEMMIDMEDS